jgi:hypothetical protein
MYTRLRISLVTFATLIAVGSTASAQHTFGHDHHVFHRPPVQNKHQGPAISSSTGMHPGSVSTATSNKPNKPSANGNGNSH